MSTAWIRSERETQDLRECVDCPPESAVYRNGDLLALQHCDRRGTWHLFVAVEHGVRPPTLEEVVSAREALLPGIDAVAVLPMHGLEMPVLHVRELREPELGDDGGNYV